MKEEKIILTKDKFEELNNEKETLTKKKKTLAKSLEQARLNDVSEDTEAVFAVSGEIENIDRRIDEIDKTLANAEVLKKSKCDSKNVKIGSVIVLMVNGKKVEYTIVSEVEADPLDGKISDKSPLGIELLKASVGKKIMVNVGDEKVEYKVESIC